MDEFYSDKKMTKKGQGIGGTFNGPSIKDILKDTMLNKLEAILPPNDVVDVAINYFRTLREIHRVFLEKEIDHDYQLILDDYERNFDFCMTTLD